MYNTEYTSLQTIGKSYAPYIGGIVKWWYTPIENLDSFPIINPVSQKLAAAPVLKAGKNWYGPVNVPDKQLGWNDQTARSAAGLFYKNKISGFIPGHDINNHINQANLTRHQICVVAKLRSGGFFIVLGNDQVGMDIDHDTSGGIGSNDTPGTKLIFSIDSKDKAYPLDEFQGDQSIPPPIFGINIIQADMEILDFNPAGDTEIAWNAGMIARFGAYPTIEVWAKDAGTGQFYKGNMAIDAVGTPPTSFIIRNAGGEGKIKIM